MTTAAREVLADCRDALAEIGGGVQGGAWRRRWIITVVLLRAVGHVLDSIDRVRTPKHEAAIPKWWSNLRVSKPVHEIFWLFIYEERNAIVKEYRTNAGQGVTVAGVTFEVNLRTGQTTVSAPRPPIHHYTMNAGHFAGCDQRTLIQEAIAWWEKELDAIDAALLN